MNRLNTFSRYWFLFVAIVFAGLAFGACSSDTTTAPPAGSSKITVMHANPGITSNLLFKNDTTTLASLAYGTIGTATLSNGGHTIAVRSFAGSQLSSVGVTLDSSTSTWVIFGGTLTQNDIFAVSSKKVTPSSSNVAVRVVNASNNIGADVSIKINDLTGLSFIQNKLAYKAFSDYVTLPVAAVTSLIVVKGDGTSATQVLSIATGAGTFTAGKSYTVVIYGSADPAADPSVKLKSAIVED